MKRFRPGIVPTLVVAVLLPMLVSLGFWQLSRGAEKSALLQSYAERRAAEPMASTELQHTADPAFRRVHLHGQFDAAHSLLLDNRQRDGKVGVELLQPFQDQATGLWLLVNRGWLPAGATRAQLPDIPPVPVQVRWIGYLYQVPGKPLVLGREEPAAGWPQVVQQIDRVQLERRLGRALFPDVVRLESSPGLDTTWTMVNLTPQQHLGYAVQWFALATALAILTLVTNSNIAEVLRRTGASEHE